jgi:hypothetical protein
LRVALSIREKDLWAGHNFFSSFCEKYCSTNFDDVFLVDKHTLHAFSSDANVRKFCVKKGYYVFFVEIQVVEWKVVERHIVENLKTNIL